jgi:hypothetical protein
MSETAIEGTAVEDTPADEAPPMPEPSTEVALAAPGSGAIIAAEQPEEILAKAQQIAAPLAQLIESAGLAVSLDRRNPDRKHVEVGGWQAAGAMLGALGGQALHAETVWTRPIAHEDGLPSWEACVEVRTAGGIVVGRAEAMCGRDERTWKTRDDYAVRSMAETRAESRAYRRAIGWIVHLAGYNPTPAEEMGHTPGASEPAAQPWWAQPASDERKKQALDATETIVGDRDKARALLKNIADQLGVLPDLIPAFCRLISASSPDPNAQVEGEEGAS